LFAASDFSDALASSERSLVSFPRPA